MPTQRSRYPRFVAEMGEERNRHKLRLGVVSGYTLVGCFAALGVAGVYFDLLEFSWWIVALVALKVVTNTLALVALRTNVLLLELSAINIAADTLCMTGAIYVTGGIFSPVVPAYFIELAVLALLTNRGITITMSLYAMFLFASMATATYLGVLPQVEPPIAYAQGVTLPYLITNIVLMGFFTLTPTIYVATMVTQLNDRERALEDRNRELLEANRAKGQFMANVTHELRTPIYGIEGLVEVMKDEVYGPVTEKQHEALDSVHRSAESLLQLVDTLLTLARSEAGKLDVHTARVDLEEALTTIVTGARWMVGKRPLDIFLELEPALPFVETDRARLVQILVNLLSNAIKFTPDGGRITIRAGRAGNRVLFEVEDSGVGIPADELVKIFEPFHQVDGSYVRAYGGTGLGLSLVRDLVRALGASIAVRSEVGKGTTFTVVLPVKNPYLAEAGEQPQEEPS